MQASGTATMAAHVMNELIPVQAKAPPILATLRSLARLHVLLLTSLLRYTLDPGVPHFVGDK